MGEEDGGREAGRKEDPWNNASYLSEQGSSSESGFCCPPAGDNITGQRELQRRVVSHTMPISPFCWGQNLPKGLLYKNAGSEQAQASIPRGFHNPGLSQSQETMRQKWGHFPF